LTYIAENKAKIRVLTWYFSHLKGRKIFQKSLGVANQKSLRTPVLGYKNAPFLAMHVLRVCDENESNDPDTFRTSKAREGREKL
jgi:hypothetical protein